MKYVLYFLAFLLFMSIVSWLKSKPFSRMKKQSELQQDPDVAYILKKLSSLDWGEKVLANKTKLSCKQMECNESIFLQHLDASILVELLRERGDHEMDIYCAPHAREKIEVLKKSYSEPKYDELLNKAKKIHVTYFKKG